MHNILNYRAGLLRAASCALRATLNGTGAALIGTGTVLIGTGRVLKVCGNKLRTAPAPRSSPAPVRRTRTVRQSAA